MLGNVSPRALRITSHPVVYSGRDNVTTLTLEVLAGRRYVPLDLSGVTRWVLALPDIAAVFDGAHVPGVFAASGNVLTLDLSGYAIADSRQPCLLVAFDAEHPNGQVLVDGADCVVTLTFSSATATGTLPMPFVPDSEVTTFTAGMVLSGHRAVYSDGVVVRYASSDSLSSAERYMGITSHAAAQGESVAVRRSGTVVEPTWSWTPGPVFLGLNGALTQVAPTTGVLLQVGVALDATTLDVRTSTPVLLD